MKFFKGVMVGTLISAGVVWMYNESNNMNTKKMLKKGKKFFREMGM